VLTVLWAAEGEISMRDIGRTLRLQSNTLTPLIKRLELLGLLVRRRNVEDERVVQITLTEQGQALKARTEGVPDCVAEACGLTTPEMEGLLASLARLQERLLAESERLERGTTCAPDAG
jgi:MarR family transcriptional regulator, organic hydroperoxide resistance regulator